MESSVSSYLSADAQRKWRQLEASRAAMGTGRISKRLLDARFSARDDEGAGLQSRWSVEDSEAEMAAFLLWNVRGKAKGKALDSLVQNLVRQQSIDVVLLMEYPFGVSQLPFLLLNDGLVKRSSSPKFGAFVRNTHRFHLLRYGLGRRANMWRWVPPSGQAGTVLLLHGFDRRNYDDSTRRAFFRRVTEAVRRREERAKHQRTIIAGDFNADPFDSAMASADGLHAIGVRAVKRQVTRAVSGAAAAMDFFYNPMWRAYGQQPQSEAGAATHYWSKDWAHELGWHMLDQVLLRPGESPRFPED